MNLFNINELLRNNPYPGRGLMLGRSEDNERAVVLYFIMGRSENSRNRIFVETDDGIKTQAFDPSKLTDPSLVIYHPVRELVLDDGNILIVTNGDQTETLKEYFSEEKSCFEALLTRKFEPDPPIYTPRISGVIFPCGSYMLSILKRLDSDPACCLRCFFTYDAPLPGIGHFISTYKSDGDPPPSFEGEPIPVSVSVAGGLESFANEIWESMDSNNKVALYARETVISTGESSFIILNRRNQ